MRRRSFAFIVSVLAVAALGGCSKKAPIGGDPSASSATATGVPVTAATTAPTAPPVMIFDPATPSAAPTETTLPNGRKRRTIKGQHAPE